VVTETTTVCAASTTKVPSGTHTLGGVTTVVTTATTVVCPYATTKTQSGGVVTSVIETTTYVCPSAGTYTIAPVTTVVSTETVVVVPVVTTYCPGTYTAPAVVTTITETDIVVYCPFTSPAPAAPTTSTAAPPPPPPPPASTPASTAAASPSASPSKSPSASTPLGNSGKQLGVTYTPYTSSGECKAAADVLDDITAIKKSGVDRIRVYSTDCDTLPNVGAACEAVGVRMIVGVFIGEVGCDNGSPDVAEQISALKSWAKWDIVDLVVIGNEALFNGYCSVTQLRDLILHVKSEIASTGYAGPVTTTDVVSAWIGSDVSAICAVVDFPCTNVHAYFNGATTPDQAGQFVAGQLKIVEDVCGKSGLILESGWPTAGETMGVAQPGKAQQKAALASIAEAVGEKTVFFSWSSGDADMWKQPGACNCEQHWGCADVLAEIFGA
jgi:exo-beta-1,3-glucanase (GH17 family)